jgi:hypothetical protein
VESSKGMVVSWSKRSYQLRTHSCRDQCRFFRTHVGRVSFSWSVFPSLFDMTECGWAVVASVIHLKGHGAT